MQVNHQQFGPQPIESRFPGIVGADTTASPAGHPARSTMSPSSAEQSSPDPAKSNKISVTSNNDAI